MEENNLVPPTTPPPLPAVPQSLPSVKTPTGRKQNIMLVSLIILTLCIISATSWFFLSNQKTSKPATPKPQEIIKLPSLAPTTNPIANWKTYTNEDFSFRYPSNLYISEPAKDSPSQNITLSTMKMPYSETNPPKFIYINRQPNTQNLTSEGYVTQALHSFILPCTTPPCSSLNDDPQAEIKKQTISVDSIPAIQIIGLPGRNITKTVFLADKNQLYQFILDPYETTKKATDKQLDKTFNQILSTFTLTDQNIPKPTVVIEALQGFSVYTDSTLKGKKEIATCTTPPVGSSVCKETMYTFQTDATPQELYQFYNLKQKNGWTQIAGEGTVAPDYKNYSMQTTWEKDTETYTLYLAARNGKILNYSISIPSN